MWMGQLNASSFRLSAVQPLQVLLFKVQQQPGAEQLAGGSGNCRMNFFDRAEAEGARAGSRSSGPATGAMLATMQLLHKAPPDLQHPAAQAQIGRLTEKVWADFVRSVTIFS